MAITQNFSLTRNEVVAATKSGGRGLVLNGQQVEMIRITKLTGDTTGGPITPEGVLRPNKVYVLPTADAAGAAISVEPTITEAIVAQTTGNTFTLSGLGTWTAAYLLVCGRSTK